MNINETDENVFFDLNQKFIEVDKIEKNKDKNSFSNFTNEKPT